MQLKENAHGVYLFFPTESGTELKQAVEDLSKIAGMLAIYSTWDLYKVIWPAMVKIQEKLLSESNQEGH